MKPIRLSSVALLLAAIASGCGGSSSNEPAPEVPEAPPPEAAAPEAPAVEAAPAQEPAKAEPVSLDVTLEAKSKSKLEGKATFTEEGDGVKVTIEISKVKPGMLATHVHEKGDCSAPDGSSAGGHFNPDSSPHARPPDEPRHLGDLGNITIEKDGTGKLEIVVKGANLKEGDPHSFLDRALIVHDKKDDGGQPTGNAGGRIGCAVIKKN